MRSMRCRAGASTSLALACLRKYAFSMSGPSTKPKRKGPVFVPHADDLADVREAFDEARKDDVLSSEESAKYLRELLGDESPRRQ